MATTEGTRALARNVVAGRQTRPTYRDGLTTARSRAISAGGMGAIPLALSGDDFVFLQLIARKGVAGIKQCYQADWRRLLRILTLVHELGGLALENDATLCTPGEDTTLIALLPDGTAEEEASLELSALFASYPHGGLAGLVASLVAAADTDGFAALEAVPDPSATRVESLFLVDGLSLRYQEGDGGAGLELQQRQSYVKMATGTTWQTLSTETVFARGWRSSDNNPLGLPRFTRFLRVGLPDIWEQLMLSDWVQGQAYGRIAAELDIDKIWQAIQQGTDPATGVNKLLIDEGGNPISPMDALQGIISEAKASFEELESSDTLFGAGMSFKAVNPGGSGIKDAFELRASRLYATLHQPPALMYSRSGGALSTSSTEELRLHKAVLTSVRAWALWFIEQAGNLHLRLRGSEATCKVLARPIQLDSGLEDARADAMRLRNAGQRVVMGFTSGDEEASEETGSPLADQAQHEAWKKAQTNAKGGATDTTTSRPQGTSTP